MFSFGGKKKILKMKEKKILFYRNIKVTCNIWAAVIHQKEMSPNLKKVEREREITLNLI
jgi:hypothetical protein